MSISVGRCPTCKRNNGSRIVFPGESIQEAIDELSPEISFGCPDPWHGDFPWSKSRNKNAQEPLNKP